MQVKACQILTYGRSFCAQALPEILSTELCPGDSRNKTPAHFIDLKGALAVNSRDIKGIGTTKSIQIEAVMELITKDIAMKKSPGGKHFVVPADTTTVCAPLKSGTSTYEEVWVMLLQSKKSSNPGTTVNHRHQGGIAF